MKSFKVREGKTLIDGILYGESPQSNPIMGKWGKIASINIGGRQFFPLSGTFDDGTTKVEVADESVKAAKVAKKTELVEASSAPMSSDGKPLKRKSGKFILNPNR